MPESDFNKYRQDESTESFQKEVLEYLEKMLDNIEVINNNTTASHEDAKQYDTHIQKMFKMYFTQSNTNIEILNKKPTQTVQKEIQPQKIEIRRRLSSDNIIPRNDNINYSDLRKLRNVKPGIIDRLAAHTYDGSGGILSKMISGSKSLLSKTLFNPNERKDSRRLLGISNGNDTDVETRIRRKPSNIELLTDGNGERNLSKETQESIELAETQERDEIDREQHKSLIEQLVALNNKNEVSNEMLKKLNGKLSDINISSQGDNSTVLAGIFSKELLTKLGPLLLTALKGSLPLVVGSTIAYATGKAVGAAIDEASNLRDAWDEHALGEAQEKFKDGALAAKREMESIKKSEEGNKDNARFLKAIGPEGTSDDFYDLSPDQQKKYKSYKSEEFKFNDFRVRDELAKEGSWHKPTLDKHVQAKTKAKAAFDLIPKDKKTILRDKLIDKGVIEINKFADGTTGYKYKNEQALIDNFTEDELANIPGRNIMENKDQDGLLSSAAAEHWEVKAKENKEIELSKIKEQNKASSSTKIAIQPAIPQTNMEPVTDLLKTMNQTLKQMSNKEPIQVTYPISNNNSNTMVPIHHRR